MRCATCGTVECDPSLPADLVGVCGPECLEVWVSEHVLVGNPVRYRMVDIQGSIYRKVTAGHTARAGWGPQTTQAVVFLRLSP